MQALVNAAVVTALYLCAPGLDAQTKEIRGLPPRATAADYQASAAAGTVTIAAEFLGHAVPTLQGPLSTDAYVVVEAGMFGQPDAGIKLSLENFSLRINGKNEPLSSQPFGLVSKSLKDPEFEPPAAASSSKSKTNINGSGAGGQAESNAPPAPVHIPIEVQRSMQQRVQKAALPEGDRTLPVAGLIFFQYSGKTKSIRSLELIYSGPAGKATLELQP
jgi:hypothetical protein